MALATYSDLLTAVAGWVKRSDLATLIPDFVTLAEVRIARDLNSVKLEKSSPITTVAGTSSYALPTDLISIIRVNRNIGLPLKSFDPLVQRPSQSGAPDQYAIDQGQIRFYPTPDNVYTRSIVYKAALAPLSAGVNEVYRQYPNIYLFATIVEAYLWMLADQRAIQWEARYKQAIKDANKANNLHRQNQLVTDAPIDVGFDIRYG